MEFREHILENGLEVIAECNPAAYSTAIAFFVKAGSRDENDANSGVSHFLEHMAFKGTPHRTAAEVNRELDEMGSHCNAFTSEEQTVYYATVLPDLQTRAVALLCDIMRPSLREDDFETEKKVIIEEIYKYDDQPPFGAHEKCMASHFGEHPLARNILGSVESVTALTPAAMREYFEQRYSPGGMVLAAAGNVDFEALVREAEKQCGQWRAFPTSRQTPPTPAHQSFDFLAHDKAAQQYTVQLSNGPAAEDEARYASRIMATIFGDDCGSRLYWEFVESGLAEYASCGAYEYQGAGLLMTFLCCAPQDTQENVRRLHDMQVAFSQTGVSQDELRRAVAKTSAHVVLQSERPGNRLFSLGSNWIQRRKYRTVKETVQAYQAVTKNDIEAMARRFPLAVNTTLSVGPLTELAGPA